MLTVGTAPLQVNSMLFQVYMSELLPVCELIMMSKSDPERFVFRGQTRNYRKNGKISMPTSFARRGCNPLVMQKWIHFCTDIIASHSGPGGFEPNHDEVQALLQHYGWRSFFVDTTCQVAVAAWFALHKFDGKDNFIVTEDCHEQGVMCHHLVADYSQHAHSGFLYLIDLRILEDLSVGIETLDRVRWSDFVTRYERQSAIMVGPCDSIPENAIIAYSEVCNEELVELSAGLTQDHLFPSRIEDIIYDMLLSAPFQKVDIGADKGLGQFGVYKRSLVIPEYDYKHVKINETSMVFQHEEYILRNMMGDEFTVVEVPSDCLYHTKIDAPDKIVDLLRLSVGNSTIVVECLDIFRPASFYKEDAFVKGAYVKFIEDKLCIGSIIVFQKGLIYSGIQVNKGWHYVLENNFLIRKKSVLDCPCNNERIHELALTILKKASMYIAKGYKIEKNGSIRAN